MTALPTMLVPQRITPTLPRQLVQLARYTTLMDLRTALRAMEGTANMTVVLVLDDRFCGHLASLVARPVDRPAMRLVLAVGSGRLPGLETIGDLASGEAALGWHEIVLETDGEEAVGGALATLRPNERLVVFAPAWHEIAGIERALAQVA